MAYKIIYVNGEPDPERDQARRIAMCESGEAPGLVVRGRAQSRVREDKRVVSDGIDGNSPLQAERLERVYREDLENKRKQASAAKSGKRRKMRMTHSVPAHLFHGKIRETGDKKYWEDPSNLKQHTDCQVEP